MKYLRIEDMPTDAAQIESDTENLFGDLDSQIEAVLVLSRQDPIEVVDGEARWSPDQQALILKAKDLVDEWQS